MDNDALLEYLLAEGAMRPEEQAMQRKQQMINQLRQPGAAMPESQMTPGGGGGPGIYSQPQRVVRPSAVANIAGIAAPIVGAFAQRNQDAAMAGMQQKRADMLRKQMKGLSPSQFPTPAPIGADPNQADTGVY